MIAMMSYSQTPGGQKRVAITLLRSEILRSLLFDGCIGVDLDWCGDEHGSVNALP